MTEEEEEKKSAVNVADEPPPPPPPPLAVYASSAPPSWGRSPTTTTNKQHRRNNTDFSALTDSEDEVSPRASIKRRTTDEAPALLVDNNHKIHLSDVKVRAPLEMEAETAILEVIQEERLENNLQQQQDIVLPMLSDEMVHTIKSEEEKKEDESRRASEEDGASPRLTRRKTKRRVVETRRKSIMDSDNSLAKKLADLSKDITDAHAEADALVDDQDNIIRDDDNSERASLLPKTNAQKMVENARVLFVRDSKNSAPQSSIKEEADDVEKGGSIDAELGGGASGSNNNSESQRPRRFGGWKGRFKKNMAVQKANAEDFQDFVVANKVAFRKQLLFVLVTITFLLIVAAILFHGFGNPTPDENGPSISWICILIARHVVMFGLAMATELIVIGYLSLELGWTVRVLGSFGSLCLVQSKGLPFRLIAWAFYSFFMLTGYNRFAQHWLFYQSRMQMLSEKNPSGDVLTSRVYLTCVLGIGFGVGLAMVFKRVWWGLRVGRGTYQRFGKPVTKLLHQMLLISKVSSLSKRQKAISPGTLSPSAMFNFEGGSKSTQDKLGSFRTVESKDTNLAVEFGSSRHSALLSQMLGEWEEPDVAEGTSQEPVSLRAMLEFRQACSLLESQYPFSLAFGPAETRAHCVDSAQRVYERLLQATPECEILKFETIASLAVLEDGTLNNEKARALIKLFRPDRDGNLSKLDFVKSIDHVWKEMRLQQASIQSAAQIDNAFEKIINLFFYFFVVFIVIAIFGFNPISFMLSLSTLVVGFAFMIGTASSKAFEGLLLILVRRPYDVGDRIAVANVDDAAPVTGSNTWFVEKVDLFTTTVRYAATNEVATMSNGSLAASRIINGKRSPKAMRYVYLKFATGTSFTKIELFRLSVEKFVVARPREWLKMNAFRAGTIMAEQGYIGYTIVLQHRESWQQIGPVLDSTAEVTSFCFELSAKLDMQYTAPPMPIQLSTSRGADHAVVTSGALEELPEMDGGHPNTV